MKLQRDTLVEILSIVKDAEVDANHIESVLIGILKKDPAFTDVSDQEAQEFLTQLLFTVLKPNPEMYGE